MSPKRDKHAWLRAVESLPAYPVVLLPLNEGGWEAVFPNLARLKAWGPDKDTCRANAAEALTFELGQLIVAGDAPPRPSDPERLIAGEDEPRGSELVMLDPLRSVLKKRLGLTKREKGGAMAATLGRLGR
jgi:predicted RNase H-like HicB family nuclease